MNREIKFRGLTSKREWIFGNYFIDEHATCVICDKIKGIEDSVIYESIGQFTVLHDKNGKEIYEGDIVKWGMHNGSEEHWHRYAVVEINPDIQFRILFYILSETGERKLTDNDVLHYGRFAYKDTENHLEIIGNIYENPELLSGGEK